MDKPKPKDDSTFNAALEAIKRMKGKLFASLTY